MSLISEDIFLNASTLMNVLELLSPMKQFSIPIVWVSPNMQVPSFDLIWFGPPSRGEIFHHHPQK